MVSMESIPNDNTPILVVDDDTGLLLSVKTTLVSAGIREPALASDSRRVIPLVKKHRFKLVILDLIMPYIKGMEILQQIKKDFPETEIIIVTAIDDVSSAVQAMRFGAYDYLVKPLNSKKLIIVINRALERYSLRQGLSLFEKKPLFSDLNNPAAFNEMVAEDEKMALVFHQAEAVAPTDYNVFISGASGTGKEMLTCVIHKLSNRAKGPFVAINMSAFSKTLFEDEFFGHAKGAFTGASGEKKGFFEEAQGGTLFLDEITELDLPLQGKLLRVIQERELYRLGSTKVKNIDVRIVVATNRDINKEVKEGRFRSDLFYRLNICHIIIPLLKDRKKDILPLAQHFLKIHAQKNNKDIRSLAPDLSEALLNYPFHGNVRELENIITSATIVEKGPVLKLSSAPDLMPLATHSEDQTDDDALLPLAEVEKRHILQALDICGGNRTRTAKILHIGLRTLQRKLKLFNKQSAVPE
jgi:DNA-binding NtrC family response regulator